MSTDLVCSLELLAESAPTKQDLYPRLFRCLRENRGPSIVYVTLQKQTEQLADDLRNQGFKAFPFHAGMPTAEKIRLQDLFMTKDDLIIVATVRALYIECYDYYDYSLTFEDCFWYGNRQS